MDLLIFQRKRQLPACRGTESSCILKDLVIFSKAHGKEKTGYCLCFHFWVNTANPWGWKARMTLFPLNEDGDSKWIVGKGKKRETPPCVTREENNPS